METILQVVFFKYSFLKQFIIRTTILTGSLRKGVLSKIKNRCEGGFAFFFFSTRPVGRSFGYRDIQNGCQADRHTYMKGVVCKAWDRKDENKKALISHK